MFAENRQSAILALADGTVLHGWSIGATGAVVGEVVFNTAMTGYQEILTDPSYCQQIVTLTYPHIGNTGVNQDDNESGKVHAAGLVVRDLPMLHSNWRSEQSLGEFLVEQGTVAIAGLDTRKLTRHLRKHGAQAGCIMVSSGTPGAACAPGTAEEAIAMARSFPGLAGMDLARVVSCQESYRWNAGSWSLEDSDRNPAGTDRRHVVAMDFGVKRNILRMLVDRQCRVTVVPAETPSREILALQPDGVFLSNGPGDPEPCNYAIRCIAELLDTGVPIFGICLGHQLLALASGAKSVKMKFGHHGANHPVLESATGKVMISSQNHGFAVDSESLGSSAADNAQPVLETTHVSLFDGTLQGLRRTDKPAFGFQGHPEASPGPHDVAALFDQFVDTIVASQRDKARSGPIENNTVASPATTSVET